MSVLTRKLLRDFAARKGQFLAVALTVFLGITLFAASYDAYLNLKTSYEEMFYRLNFANLTVVGGDVDALAEEGASLPGVAQASTRRVADVPLRIGGSHKLLGRAVELPRGRQPAVNQVMMLSGAYLSSSADTTVLVEQHMASHFDLAEGDTLEVQSGDGWRQVRIGGVVASTEYLWPARNRQDLLGSPDDFGVLFAPPPLVDSLPPLRVSREAAFYFEEGLPNTELEDELSARASAHGADDVFTRAEQPSNALLQEDVQGFGDLSLLFPLLFLGGAGMATYILLTRLVYTQRSHIGMLMANGFARRTIFAHYLGYGLAAAAVGAVPAAIAGSLLARLITGFYTEAIAVPVTVVEFRPTTIVAGVLFALGAGALSALSPARRAMRVTPAEAMRGPVTSGTAGVSLIERLFPPLRRAPIRVRTVIRSIGRNRRRSLSSVIGVVLALVLILTSWGMIDTIDILLDKQFETIQRQDAQVTFAPQSDEKPAEALQSVPGIATAEPLGIAKVSVSGKSGLYSTTLMAYPRGTEMHRFLTPEGDGRDLPAEGLLLGSALRDILDVEPGDSVTLRIQGTDLSVSSTVAGFVQEPLGTFAYASLPDLTGTLEERLGPEGLRALQPAASVTLEPGADREAVRDRVNELPAVIAYQDSRTLQRVTEDYMSLFYVFVGVMLAFGGVMAFALIYNTMAANISERSGEIASLTAAGVARRRITALVTSENLLLSLLGIAPGLALGYGFSWVFMQTYSNDMFRLDLHMRPTTLIFSALLILLVAVLSQRPLLRTIRRLDVARILRERSV